MQATATEVVATEAATKAAVCYTKDETLPLTHPQFVALCDPKANPMRKRKFVVGAKNQDGVLHDWASWRVVHRKHPSWPRWADFKYCSQGGLAHSHGVFRRRREFVYHVLKNKATLAEILGKDLGDKAARAKLWHDYRVTCHLLAGIKRSVVVADDARRLAKTSASAAAAAKAKAAAEAKAKAAIAEILGRDISDQAAGAKLWHDYRAACHQSAEGAAATAKEEAKEGAAEAAAKEAKEEADDDEMCSDASLTTEHSDSDDEVEDNGEITSCEEEDDGVDEDEEM